MKSRGIAIILCFLLGVLGAHHFYLDNTATGLIYLLSSTIGWCFVIPPIIIGIMTIIDLLGLLIMSDASFHRLYNSRPIQYPIKNTQNSSNENVVETLQNLKKLYENNIISLAEYEEKRRNLLDKL